MLVAILSIIEMSKLLFGYTTAVMGMIMLTILFLNWLKLVITDGSLGKLGWTVAGGQTLLSVILMIAGFYIAGW